jgi:iron complex transport system permease protein
MSNTIAKSSGISDTAIKFAVISILAVTFFLLNIAFGSVHIPIADVIHILSGKSDAMHAIRIIVLETRLPQTITAVLAGSALGVSGLMMQTLFRNPMAGPSVLGISSGASLGVAVLMLFINMPGGRFITFAQMTGNFGLVPAAFAGALPVLIIMAWLARKYRSNAIVLIIGIMIAYAVSAIVGILQFYSLKEDLQAFVFWGLGSFANVSWQGHNVFIPLILSGLFLSVVLIKPMNIMLLGENYARNLGIDSRRSGFAIIMVAGLLVATVTAYCGPIAFLGVAIPHLSRNIFKTSGHLINVPGTMLLGMLIALACNLIARLPGFDGALPINAVTSLFGAPVVIWVLLKSSRNQELL